MNLRIRTLRKALELNQKDFAARIGLKQNTISNMEQPGGTITEHNIKSICAQLNVSEKWLRTGEGEMFMKIEKREKEFFEIFNELSPVLQDYLVKTARELLNTQSKMNNSEEEK